MTMRNYPHSRPIDATIRQAEPFTIDLAARGGGGLNTEYADGLAALIIILLRHRATLTLVEVVSRPMMARPAAERVVPIELGWPMKWDDYPGMSVKSQMIRKAIMRGIAKVGRKPGAKGGGNPNKKIRLHYLTPDPYRDPFGRRGKNEDISWADHMVEDSDG